MNQPNNPYSAPMTDLPAAIPGAMRVSRSPELATAAIENYFKSRGYRMETGTNFDGIYGKGNDLLRFLLGGFVARYKIKVKIMPAQGGCLVSIEKGMSGAMGGALGYARMSNELKVVNSEIAALLNR